MRARIRNLWGEYSDAEIVDLENPAVVCVVVPVLGHLIVPLTGRTTAVLTHGPGSEVERPVTSVDGHLEVELLPNSSGEDRIVVVIDDE